MATFDPLFIELDAGRIRSTTITDANGSRPDYSHVGDLMFFVDVVESDGGRIGLWSGTSYDHAIREAYDAARGFGLTDVRDAVGGTL